MSIVLRFLGALCVLFSILTGCGAQPSQPLDTSAIKSTFSNVRDDAVIQDSKGSTAVNFWYADGTFVNNWRNSTNSGTVTGTWYAKDNKRCVKIEAGMESINGQTRCGEIVLKGNTFKSFNPDGSVHAVHTLSPIKTD